MRREHLSWEACRLRALDLLENAAACYCAIVAEPRDDHHGLAYRFGGLAYRCGNGPYRFGGLAYRFGNGP